jgi:uncharacterized protein YukE
MSDQILYDPHAIDGLGNIEDQNQKMRGVADDIRAAFKSLADAYTGRSADGFTQAYSNVDSELSDAQDQLAHIQQKAIDHHNYMHALDAQGASKF